MLFFLPSCGAGTQGTATPSERTQPAVATTEGTGPGTTAAGTIATKPKPGAKPGETTGAVAKAPAKAPKGMPKYRNFFEEGKGNEPVRIQGAGGSAGAIPAVKPFNFGRDPGGPKDKTLYLTIPKLGLQSIPVFDDVSEEALKNGTAHVPATGYPWQKGANVYVAGHRLGYPGTASDKVFYNLDQLAPGDRIFVGDSAGGQYSYTVIKQAVVPPDNVEVMNPVPGKSLLSLQTCTLPDYAERIVVQAEQD